MVLFGWKSAAVIPTFKKKVTLLKLQWIGCSADMHTRCFNGPVSTWLSLNSNSSPLLSLLLQAVFSSLTRSIAQPLHPSSLATPLLSPSLKTNMSALCISHRRSHRGDVNAAFHRWPTHYLFESSSSYPPTLTSTHPPPPVIHIILLDQAFTFLGTPLSVFHWHLTNRVQCKASLNHINLISQPLTVFHHIFCQLVIFYSKAVLSLMISWISIWVISFLVPPRLRISHENRSSSKCSGPGSQHL